MTTTSVTLANEDGTGGAQQRQGQGIARPSVETAAQGRAATPGKEERERDTARRAPENHRYVQQHGRKEGDRKMARRTQTNTGRRETNDRRRENDVRTNRTNSQMKRIIKGILGEQGKDKTYEERGAGKRNKRTTGRDGKENEDRTEGQDEDKYRPAGREKTKTEDETECRDGNFPRNKNVTTARASTNRNSEGQAEDKDGPAERDRTKTEDKPGGRDKTVTKDRTAKNGGGACPDQDTGGSNGR